MKSAKHWISRGLAALCLIAVFAPVSRGQESLADAWARAKAMMIPADKPITPIRWITIPGGNASMGSPAFADAQPIHKVSIKTFEISETLVTVEQYAECVRKGPCTKPDTGENCNWTHYRARGRQRHPINCVDWQQAADFARFANARLPSESEWEYAATSGGKTRKYPWGDGAPTCDKAVISLDGVDGCGSGGTLPVGSKPAGDTAQGLRDMAGDVMEWVQDTWHGSYAGAPADGSAWVDGEMYHVLRGGAFTTMDAGYLRADSRTGAPHHFRQNDIGFRVARSD